MCLCIDRVLQSPLPPTSCYNNNKKLNRVGKALAEGIVDDEGMAVSLGIAVTDGTSDLVGDMPRGHC